MSSLDDHDHVLILTTSEHCKELRVMQAELIINWPLQTKNPFYDYWDSFNLKFSVFVVYRPVHNMDTTSTTRSASWEDFNKDPTTSYLDLHIIRPQHRPQLDRTDPASLICLSVTNA